ncbi:MAG: transglutaminase domain-containing protein [Ruminiclostridium sp.]|nr:transglutaminase domain-containing protein [Ruminiclostridium sp.]
MSFINTRFSHERRVKLILMCVSLIVVSYLICGLTVYSENEGEVFLPSSRVNLIRTSNTGDNYSVFETNGNTITARGVYTGDNIRKLYIDKNTDDMPGSYSMKGHEDGSYEAELTMPASDGIHRLTVRLNSGASLRYNIFYDSTNGWYFPVSGFEKTNRNVFEHIYEAPAEAAALYLSPTKDTGEINATLEQISALTEQITAGIDDDYEKARAISRFISEKIYYDMDAKSTNVDIETIALCNVLKKSRTVCSGFTNLFCAMAEAAGIDAVNIKGGINNETDVSYQDYLGGAQNHEWAAFWYEKEQRWVWADPCWDGSGNYEKGEWKEGKPKYMFFDISEDALALNHRADKAERRHYFSAGAETEPLGAEDPAAEEGERSPVITSQQTEPAVTAEPPAPEETAPVTAEIQPEIPESADEKTDTVLIIIIAVLAAAVAAVGAFTVYIIVKGRKQ